MDADVEKIESLNIQKICLHHVYRDIYMVRKQQREKFHDKLESRTNETLKSFDAEQSI